MNGKEKERRSSQCRDLVSREGCGEEGRMEPASLPACLPGADHGGIGVAAS